MSFILDALKKSDKKRDETVVPNLHTVHGSARPVAKKKPLWPYLLVAVLLLNAGILLWVLAPSGESPAPVTAVVPPIEALVAPLSSLVEVPAPLLTSEPVLASEPEPVVADPPVVVVTAEVPSVVVAETVLPSVVEVTRLPALSAEISPTIVAAESASPRSEVRGEDEWPIYAIVDLPYDVQSRLPEINVSVYAYSSDAAFRLVRINNRIFREGSYLEEGLLLNEITPTYLLFSFEGYRFRVPKK